MYYDAQTKIKVKVLTWVYYAATIMVYKRNHIYPFIMIEYQNQMHNLDERERKKKYQQNIHISEHKTTKHFLISYAVYTMYLFHELI